MADNSEEFLIRLKEQISGPAKVANTALSQLESRILRQQSVVSGYEDRLGKAAAKLQVLSAARGSAEGEKAQAKAIAAFAKQQAAVAALGSELEKQRQDLASLEGARGIASQVDQMNAAKVVAEAAAAKQAAAAKVAAAAAKEAAAAQAAADSQKAAAQAQASAAYKAAVASGDAAAKRSAAIIVAAEKQKLAAMKATAAEQKQAAEKWNANAKSHHEMLAKERALTHGTGQSAKGLSVNLGELGGKLGQLGGPLGQAGMRAGQLGGAFQKLGALGAGGIFVGIAVAVVAVAAALAYATYAATKWAISMADAARNQRLSLESLAANYKALVDIATIAPRVASATGLATDEIQQLAEQLAKAKIPAKNLEVALKAMATAKAGGATAEFLEKLQKALIATGKVPKELAEQFSKFEAIASKKMLSLDAQGAKFKANVGGLFAGLKIDGFLAALAKVVALFDSSTSAGKGLKLIIETIFQPLIDGAAKAIPMVVTAFLAVEVIVLEVILALKKLSKALDLSPPKIATGPFVSALADIGAGANFAAAALNALHGAMGSTGAAAATASTGVAASAARMGSAWQQAKAQAEAAVAGVAGAASQGGQQTTAVGAAMSAGMAAGITSGAAGIVAAMTAAVAGAVSAARSQLDSHSPSRLFWKLGLTAPEGMAGGVDEGAVKVQRSFRDMATPKLGAAAGAGGTTAKSGNTYNLDFSGSTFGEGLDEGKLEGWLRGIFHRLELETES